jgi:hypothetical protein
MSKMRTCFGYCVAVLLPGTGCATTRSKICCGHIDDDEAAIPSERIRVMMRSSVSVLMVESGCHPIGTVAEKMSVRENGTG